MGNKTRICQTCRHRMHDMVTWYCNYVIGNFIAAYIDNQGKGNCEWWESKEIADSDFID